jgi:tRNA(Ile)-lysidine synthase
MAPQSDLDGITLVRPLLGVWRRDILAYLKEIDEPYRHDASNDDRRFLRNRIRHELLPRLERDYNPRIKESLVQLASHSRCDSQYLRAAAARQWRRAAKVIGPAEIALDAAMLRRQPEALQRQLVQEAVQQVRGDLNQFETRHWREIEILLAGRPEGAVVDLPEGLQVVRRGTRIVCRRMPASRAGIPPSRRGPACSSLEAGVYSKGSKAPIAVH